MTKWQSLVAATNAKIYVLPAGWDSRETVAQQLECSVERVREHLTPAIKAGTVEVKTFKVWDKDTHRNVMMTAYRRIQAKTPAGR